MAPKSTTLAAAAFLLAALLSALLVGAAPSATHDIRAVFAFGDSTLDPGNNNRLNTLVRADHPPYGRDFPGGAATGRFTDGRLITDFLVSALGIKDFLPAYHSDNLTAADAATGVSFASAGSGIDDLTSMSTMVSAFPSQLMDFGDFLQQLGPQKAAEVVNKSLFIVSIGTNDVVMNYYLLPTRKTTNTLEQYHAILISMLQSSVQALYNNGARRIMVAGMPPVGCLPLQMTAAGRVPRTCVEEQNDAAESYNTALQQSLAKLQGSLPGAKIVYADIYTPLKDMIDHPQKYGFVETTLGCCGTGLMEMGALCSNPLPSCPLPSQFLFWDSVHPTEAAYKTLAAQLIQAHVLDLVS